MEEIKVGNELKLCGVKRDNLRNALENIKSQASDILLFSLQWSDLEDYLKTVEGKLEQRFRELESKEVELQNRSFALDERAKAVEAAEAEVCDLEMKADGFRRKIEDEEQELGILGKSVEECTVEQRSKASQLNEMVESLRKTQVEFDLKGEQLAQLESHLERHRVEASAEKEYLGRNHTRRRELDEGIERKTKDLTLVQDKIAECEKLLETRSSELVSKEKKLEVLSLDLDLREQKVKSLNNETCQQMESKAKELEDIERLIEERSAHYESIKLSMEEHTEELASKEKRQKASLMEREQGIGLKEKEIDAREEMIDEKDQQLKSIEQKLAKCVKDYELKAKKLSSFCQQSNPEQNVALAPVNNVLLLDDKPEEQPPSEILRLSHKAPSKKRGRNDESFSQSRGNGFLTRLNGSIKCSEAETHGPSSCTTGQENIFNFENQRSVDKFQIDQIWAIYSNDKGTPRKYVQIKRIDTSPEFKLHVAPLELYRFPNLMTHPVCCGRFKLKTGKAQVLVPSCFSHQVKAVKRNKNRFEVYPGKDEIWALYKNWNTTDCAETEELEIVEIVETDEQSIQAVPLTAKGFNKPLYGRCQESKAGFIDIPRTQVCRFSHQIPAFRHETRATPGDSQCWELDPKAVLDLNSKNP